MATTKNNVKFISLFDYLENIPAGSKLGWDVACLANVHSIKVLRHVRRVCRNTYKGPINLYPEIWLERILDKENFKIHDKFLQHAQDINRTKASVR